MVLDDTRCLQAGRKAVLTQTGTGSGEDRRIEASIEWLRQQHGRWVLKLADIDSIDQAEKWIGGMISVPQQTVSAPEGAFFGFELEGCEILAGGERLGSVAEVLDYEGAPLLKIDRAGKELLIPFAREFLRSVDIEAKRIEVVLPEGLVELND